jgi:hypothetical protein
MVPGGFGKEGLLAALAAEAQAPMMMTDQPKLAPTVGTSVLWPAHVTLLWLELATLICSAARIDESLSE